MLKVVDDAAEAAESNGEEEAVARRKSDPKRALARAQAKLVCAAKAGTLRDWRRACICDWLGAMGLKVPYNMKPDKPETLLCNKHCLC